MPEPTDSPSVDTRDGGYYIAGTLISLGSVGYAFNDGDAAQTIQQSFPVLRLRLWAKIQGARALMLNPKS